MRRGRWLAASLLALVLAANVGCGVQRMTRRLTPPEFAKTLDGKSRYLKAHARDGRVFVFGPDWSVAPDGRSVAGDAKILDANRRVFSTGPITLPVDSVAIFETNVLSTSPAVIALSVLTAASLGLTVYCVTHPKSCFGSCPTFYSSDGSAEILQAEGFSAGIAPALERSDVDALFRARPADRTLEIVMRNEALETHVVRSVDLLVVPRAPGARAFATASGEFREATALVPPMACGASEGDCVEALRAFDGVERWSLADSTDLAARETIDLAFPDAPDGDFGLVVACRQSLLPTYVFYQALAYLGHTTAEWFASLDRGNATAHALSGATARAIGRIEVLLPAGAAGWVSAGSIHETGPLATDVHLLPLPRAPAGPVTVRLRLARGNWRLDYVALARLGARREAARVRPSAVVRDGSADSAALRALLDSTRVLTTLPGDEYRITYALPEDPSSYEFFLESRRYYLEWMREEWLAEENPGRAAAMFLDPGRALREMAPTFKAQEEEMEERFWKSRYARR